jgi:hypothetical protein
MLGRADLGGAGERMRFPLWPIGPDEERHREETRLGCVRFLTVGMDGTPIYVADPDVTDAELRAVEGIVHIEVPPADEAPWEARGFHVHPSASLRGGLRMWKRCP